jgi:hypothetical protein
LNKLLLFLIGFVVALPAFASSTTCPSGTFALYLVPNFSCQSGNLIFTGFTYSGTGNPTEVIIPADSINTQPLTVTGQEGLQFASGWSVGTQTGGMSSFQNSLITFVVTDTHGIGDLILGFNGSFTGTGTSSTSENFCMNATTVVGCPVAKSGTLNVTNPPPFFNNVFLFGSVTSIAISDNINVTSGTNGTAAASQVINEFSGIPEPLTGILLGSGLIGLGLLRRRMVRR